MYFTDLFALGAIKRTLAQSQGFQVMIETKHFPSAAILLRTQIDSAMRINGVRYLADPEVQPQELFKGTKTFRKLVSSQKTAKGKPILMQNIFLRNKPEEEHPWIGKVYEKTSDFVHLSFAPIFNSIQKMDNDHGPVNFVISGEDNTKDDTAYYEICDAFFDVSKLLSTSLLRLLIAKHARETSNLTPKTKRRDAPPNP